MDFGVFFREGHCNRRYSLFTISSVLFVSYDFSPGLAALDGSEPGFAWMAAAILLLACIVTSGFGSIRNGTRSTKMVVATVPAIVVRKADVSDNTVPLLQLVTTGDNSPNSVMYFGPAGILSGFSVNVSISLMFFNSAGGDFSVLQGDIAYTLLAISTGAVFMCCKSYIGNARISWSGQSRGAAVFRWLLSPVERACRYNFR